jgi:exodeoxyribonuclease VII small subunit
MPRTARPAPDSAATDAPPSFEAALQELERLVAKMEGGDLSLEQSLAAHKRGLELARICQNTLRQAEQQVRVLEDDMLKSFPGRRAHDPGDDADG